ncbi:MAG: cytochrome c oxidase subunit II [Desulforhopalus sp.]|jgi:cytochrome c oxidase subunit 2|nr:cytochrome c oxidase subunit II [Desulforhopalus sp.]
MSAVHGVDLAFWYILGISVVLLFGITAVMVYFVIRYRRSRHPVPADIRDNYTLEILWTIIPTLIAMSMFYVGWTSYIGLRTVPEGAMEVEVIGQQYSWIFVYENDKETENELVVPQGRAIKLNISSEDVLHSFYLPAFRVKVDAVKGMPTYAWFFADEVGEYDIQCTEYCGVDHWAMIAKLHIVPEEEFVSWLEE